MEQVDDSDTSADQTVSCIIIDWQGDTSVYKTACSSAISNKTTKTINLVHLLVMLCNILLLVNLFYFLCCTCGEGYYVVSGSTKS